MAVPAKDTPGRLRARLMGLAVCVLAFACDPSSGDREDAGIDAGMLERTVRVGVLRVGERRLLADDDGSVAYPEVTLLGDVTICVAERRAAFASFEPFIPLEKPNCATNMANETAHLDGVPANSDLIITYAKSGYATLVTTFRTDEFDVEVPSWADNMAYFIPMLREDEADPFIEPEPARAEASGLAAVWVVVTADWGHGSSAPSFASEGDPGVAQGEGAKVAIETADASPVIELEVRRDRPLFVPLEQGSYAMRFSNQIMELVPVGVQEQFMITGLPTDDFETIEVPVREDSMSLAAIELYCPLPSDSREFADLATCMLEEAEGAQDP